MTRVLIIGCGRVGARTAVELDARGHEVTVIDVNPHAFNRLPASFGVPRVIAKINDPLRAEAYRALGLETICRTVILADALVEAAEHGFEATADSFVQAATAEPLRGAPPPGTQAEDHAQAAIAAERDETPAAGE